MLTIIDIEFGSIAEELGIEPGASLITINGKEIHDELDYRFYNNSDELEVLIDQDGEQVIYEIEKEPHADIGLIVEEMQMRTCGNHCLFCFVHQNPKGLRKALYVKDEDYRFSFLDGHYVTLTNVTSADLTRIVEQRLSPLYISVHVTDSERRKFMLGRKKDDHLLEKLDFLCRNNIELHTQIVLCPGLNDGTYLDQTIDDLKSFYPMVGSIAVVPVGLTQFRNRLPKLTPVCREYSMQTIEIIENKRRNIKSEIGSSFVYLADEFYISTNLQLPGADYYEDFPQLENGVGLTRDLITRFQEELPHLSLPAPMKLTLVSGLLGSAALDQYIVPQLRHIPRLQFSLVQVKNTFYGESITVAGLLVGQDIYAALKNEPLGDYVILPPRILNYDKFFLDDWHIHDLEKKLARPVLIFPDSFTSLFNTISKLQTGKAK